MKELTSIASLQTKGLKRLFQEEDSTAPSRKPKYSANDDEQSEYVLNSISGSKKRKALLKAGLWDQSDDTHKDHDSNVVGFEVDSIYCILLIVDISLHFKCNGMIILLVFRSHHLMMTQVVGRMQLRMVYLKGMRLLIQSQKL